MKKDPYKLRAVALLIALGFVGGMFLQYQAPGTFVFASYKTKKKAKKELAGNADAFLENGSEDAAPRGAALDGPPSSEAAGDQKKRDEEAARKAEEAEKNAAEAAKKAAEAEEKAKQLQPDEVTPPLLRGYAAVGAVVDNTLEITGPNGEKRYLYFAPRGVAAEFSASGIEARLWSRDDDRLCRSLAGDKRECFYLAVHLNDEVRKGKMSALPDRINALETGARIGSVEGAGATNVQLLRGNVRGLPGYIPLLEGKPEPEWTQDPGASASAGSIAGALLLRQRRDADRAVTFFSPAGQVFEVSRLARHTVSLWIGAWRRQGDLICRELKPEADQAGPRSEECARPRVTDRRIDFPEAGPSWRSFFRSPWPDEEPEVAGPATSEPASPTGEVVLGPRRRKAGEGSFTDLR